MSNSGVIGDIQYPDIVNLTYHDVKVYDPQGLHVLKTYLALPRDRSVRWSVERATQGSLAGVSVYSLHLSVTNLPEPQPGRFFIVPKVVQEALPERGDLITADTRNGVVEDQYGNVMGIRYFFRINDNPPPWAAEAGYDSAEEFVKEQRRAARRNPWEEAPEIVETLVTSPQMYLQWYDPDSLEDEFTMWYDAQKGVMVIVKDIWEVDSREMPGPSRRRQLYRTNRLAPTETAYAEDWDALADELEFLPDLDEWRIRRVDEEGK